ncbi:MAG: DUF523 domain-containing protein [Planctomycetota bacterium]
MAPTERTRGEPPVLVSACLLGMRTRYDGAHCRREKVLGLLGNCHFVPVCPEQMGGLATPRPPAEIEAGDGRAVLDGRSHILRPDGLDVTENFLRGARMVAELAELTAARRAIFKEGSPSCGVTEIRRNGEPVAGCGVTTALLQRKGLRVDGIR